MSKDDDAVGGFTKIAGGLANLINLLVDLDKSGNLPRHGRREKNGVVVEYSIGRRTAVGEAAAEPPPSEEPAARPARRAAKRTDIEVVEPVTDMFDEAGEAVLLFELPGVSRSQVRCLLDGDILLLEAKTAGRLYRKETLIEAKLAGDPPKLRLHNGVLEVRLKKQV
ncbi:MAG: Hsp20/alpha crystallin family protein [Roseiarcus sp.]|jgi:HSP20 family molecular chaperone IbpA